MRIILRPTTRWVPGDVWTTDPKSSNDIWLQTPTRGKVVNLKTGDQGAIDPDCPGNYINYGPLVSLETLR